MYKKPIKHGRNYRSLNWRVCKIFLNHQQYTNIHVYHVWYIYIYTCIMYTFTITLCQMDVNIPVAVCLGLWVHDFFILFLVVPFWRFRIWSAKWRPAKFWHRFRWVCWMAGHLLPGFGPPKWWFSLVREMGPRLFEGKSRLGEILFHLAR